MKYTDINDIEIEIKDYQLPDIIVSADDTSVSLKLFADFKDIQSIDFDWDTVVLCWKYGDNKGGFFETTTGAGSRSVLLTIPNMYFGRQITISVFFAEPPMPHDTDGMQWSWEYENIFCKQHFGKISFTIKCKEKKVKQIEWISPQDNIYTIKDDLGLEEGNVILDMIEVLNIPATRSERTVFVGIDILGYNNETITARKTISENNKIIRILEEKIEIYTNGILIAFRESEAGINMTRDRTLQFELRLYDSDGVPIPLADGSVVSIYEYTFKGITLTPEESYFPVQPVIIGSTPHIEDNNFMPCKYEGIKFSVTADAEGEKPPKTTTLFQERTGINKDTVNIVGGKRHVTIKLINYSPDCCKREIIESQTQITDVDNPMPYSHKKRPALYKPYNKGYKTITIPDDNTIVQDIEYEYPVWSLLSSIQTLKYFFPWSDKLMQQHIYKFATCRHSNTVFINMYPDIEWKITAACDFSKESYKSTIVNEYTASSQGATGITEKDEAVEKKKESIEKYNKKYPIDADDVQLGSTFSLDVSNTYNDGVQNTDFNIDDIVARIRTYLTYLRKIKKTADDVVDTVANKNNMLPANVKIEFPKLQLSGKWKLTQRTATQIGIDGDIDLVIDPLIKATFELDLIKFGSKAFPLVGLVTDIIEQGGIGSVRLIFKIYGGLSVKIAGAKFTTNPDEFSAEASVLEGKFGVRINLRIYFGLEGEGLKCSAAAKIEGNASLDGYFGGTITPGIDSAGLYATPEAKFSGIKAKLSLKFEFRFKTTWFGGFSIGVGDTLKWEGTLIEPSAPHTFEKVYFITNK